MSQSNFRVKSFRKQSSYFPKEFHSPHIILDEWSLVIIRYMLNHKMSNYYQTQRLKPLNLFNIERRGASPGQAFQTKKLSFIVNDTHAIQVIGCQISTNQTRSEMYRIVNHPPTRNHPRFRISGQIT